MSGLLPLSPRLLPGLALGTLILLSGCSGGKSDPASPAASTPVPPSLAQGELPSSGVSGILGQYDLTVSGDQVVLEPRVARSGVAQGDSYDADITDFFTQFPCSDCLKIVAFGLTPDFDVWVDVAMRHPYTLANLPGGRADLVVYDTRLILIPELDLLSTFHLKFDFFDSPKVEDGSPGGVDAIGVWDIVRNADGYTHHHDLATVDGVKFDGTLNPFKWYFNEDDPSADFEGAAIPNRAFRPGDGPDIKRWLIDITDPDFPGLTTRKFRLVIEASWGQGTTKADRINSEVRLPEYNMKEAYDVQTNLPQTLFDSTPQNTLVTFEVAVLDWQAQAITGTGLDQLNCPSDVRAVTFDLPGLPGTAGLERIFPMSAQTIPTGGTGLPGDPYIFSFTLPTQPGPDLSGLVRDDPYLALIRVEDEYMDTSLATQCVTSPADADGKLRANFIGVRLNNTEPTTTIDDFVAYRIVPVFVRPAGPPTITLNPVVVDQVKGLATLSGTILGLDSSTLGQPAATARTITTITQVGPGAAPMNTPWTLPLQPDQYGRYLIVMPLLPGGANTFTVTANNQYTGTVPGATANASYPGITWNVDALTQPSFRVSVAWSPQLYNPTDVSDMDLHAWIPTAPAATTFDHLYYCNANGTGNGPGTSAKPCTTSASIVQMKYTLRDDNGFGPEVMDGINNFTGTSLQINSRYPIGVNYFTNRLNSMAHPINMSMRVATFVGTPDLQIFTNPAIPAINRENGNSAIEFYAGQGMLADYENSWWRPLDLVTDVGGNVSIGAPAVAEANLAY